jgi:tRNA(Ile)-lysidine synthase
MRYIVAYSGGLDSSCLLHMLRFQQLVSLSFDPKIDSILAIHINHGLSPNAKAWQLHCRDYCAQLHIPFKAIEIQVDKNSNESIEAVARHLRYAALAEVMQEGDILLTAHHIDDQAETFLLQALRGAGVKGLAAMPDKKVFACGELWRPLLGFSRQQLLTYATEQQLNWVEDESNLQNKYARNFLRREIFPLLKQQWPSAASSLAQASEYCAAADELCDDLAKVDATTCITERQTIAIAALLKLSLARQKNVLRYWLRQQYFTVPAGNILQRILTEAIPAAKDANPIVAWQDGEVRRYKDELYALSLAISNEPLQPIAWDWSTPLPLNGKIIKMDVNKTGVSVDDLAETLTIEFRQMGERIKLFGHKHHKSLKKLLQEWQVPPWERDKLALIFSNGTLIAAPPYYQAVSHNNIGRQYRCYIT